MHTTERENFENNVGGGPNNNLEFGAERRDKNRVPPNCLVLVTSSLVVTKECKNE